MSAFPWVCGPGERLPPAPPLWACADDERIVALNVGMAPPVPPGCGWFEAVDAEGRSR